eukprot:m.120121 g.120121  ORF g.120121 m.120121 type:complete len:486 (+) comp17243_c2_seq29:215-1672(+)
MVSSGAFRDSLPQVPLLRTQVLVSVVLLLFWLSAAGVVLVYSSFFLDRECQAVGLDSSIHKRIDHDGGCFDNKSNLTQHRLYTNAQSRASAKLGTYSIVSGIANLASVPAFGALADCKGRKIALCTTLLLNAFASLAVALLNEDLYIFIAAGVFNLGGGSYAVVGTGFSIIADVTPHLTIKQRAKVFGFVEATLWVGLLIGPVAAGALIARIGPHRTFFFLALTPFLAAALMLMVFRETLVSRKPIVWSRCNPVVSIYFLTTNPYSLRVSIMVLFAFFGGIGHTVVLPLYCYNVLSMQPQQTGFLQTAEYASAAFGLMVVLPLLTTMVSTKGIFIIAMTSGILTYVATGLVSTHTAIYIVASCLFLNGLYFPVVRCARTIADTLDTRITSMRVSGQVNRKQNIWTQQVRGVAVCRGNTAAARADCGRYCVSASIQLRVEHGHYRAWHHPRQFRATAGLRPHSRVWCAAGAFGGILAANVESSGGD